MTPEQMFRTRIARRLKKAREKSGLSQTVAAERMQMHRNAISRWENGTHLIGFYEFVRYAELLDRKPFELLAEILAPAEKWQEIYDDLRAELISVNKARELLGLEPSQEVEAA